MSNKLRLWQENRTWNESEKLWDEGAEAAAKKHPIKTLKELPKMPGITAETAKHLKWKSFKWMITKDHKKEVWRGFWKRPLVYGSRLIKSMWKKKSFKRDDDFFLYGIDSVAEFQQLLNKNSSLFVVGFSYCHKPFECPSGRFTPYCIYDPNHPVCRQCFIGKAINALPEERAIPLLIPTVHYIGGKIFEIVHRYPERQVVFLITACELTLEMFGDWGNMAGIKGIGVRLDGRICNTMQAFKLSEEGIKPGLTVVLEKTQQRILNIIKQYSEDRITS